MIKIATFYDSVFPHIQGELWRLDDQKTYRLTNYKGPREVDCKIFNSLDQAIKYARQIYLHDAH